ncbi:conserved unknown protein [Ectocarpus siliculosus]|uniref:FeS cluster biogenesis domain-containing protein n=1 Tax=Ectocarpus siliculosus TaxID=2880 RepID=D7G8E7_ECTSI|nr:conserved unknown protein [Ectocarpus siliculosus]|eukprot:CBJ27992.1 conserved unknown protein [Ectocarpus siliculosus]
MVTRSQAPALLQSRQLSSAASAAAPTVLFGDTIIVTKRCAEVKRAQRGQDAAGPEAPAFGGGGGVLGVSVQVLLGRRGGGSEFERDGAVLVVDATSLEFVKGATVDFEEDMMRSAFAVLNNPVSESACGCGSSFALKNFEKNPALD